MKQGKILSLALVLMIASSAVIHFTACKQDHCRGVICLYGGYCTNGICGCVTGYYGNRCQYASPSSIVYTNDAFTPVYININDTAKDTIAPGASLTLHGLFTDTAGCYAVTYSQTGTGALTGDSINWYLRDTFPDSGTLRISFDVPAQWFFLTVADSSLQPVAEVDVNHQLTGTETDEIMIIPNTGLTYGLGYYPADTNSNIYFYSSSRLQSWAFPVLNLPMTINQHYNAVLK